MPLAIADLPALPIWAIHRQVAQGMPAPSILGGLHIHIIHFVPSIHMSMYGICQNYIENNRSILGDNEAVLVILIYRDRHFATYVAKGANLLGLNNIMTSHNHDIFLAEDGAHEIIAKIIKRDDMNAREFSRLEARLERTDF